MLRWCWNWVADCGRDPPSPIHWCLCSTWPLQASTTAWSNNCKSTGCIQTMETQHPTIVRSKWPMVKSMDLGSPILHSSITSSRDGWTMLDGATRASSGHLFPSTPRPPEGHLFRARVRYQAINPWLVMVMMLLFLEKWYVMNCNDKNNEVYKLE